ncbi:MAG: hypothetical protein LAT75_07300 [Candidatus Cyclonatronum sp.]|uniref:TlpA family protein disulfide reductase n=1 Tax=Cyclonatronum sp. TaxID=3024185 RepID=UPI0025B86000|nr:hypothetical protein [Cyclonatronum sp.]MCC5933867.1 hypothetical protein [Balneolales bacterium]MCH8486655.1 hypothetical protein [Cyclonatronum sp.]
MRLDQKYFIPFMLVVAGICVVLIVFFNLRFMGSQQQRFAERVGDGQAHLEQLYPAFFEAGDIRPADFTGEQPLILLFWSSWSGRSDEAQQDLFRRISAHNPQAVVISAAVKDNAEFVREIAEIHGYPFIFVDGTEHYNDVRLPGLPSLIAFRADGSLFGSRLGFTGAADYDFLDALLKGQP